MASRRAGLEVEHVAAGHRSAEARGVLAVPHLEHATGDRRAVRLEPLVQVVAVDRRPLLPNRSPGSRARCGAASQSARTASESGARLPADSDRSGTSSGALAGLSGLNCAFVRIASLPHAVPRAARRALHDNLYASPIPASPGTLGPTRQGEQLTHDIRRWIEPLSEAANPQEHGSQRCRAGRGDDRGIRLPAPAGPRVWRHHLRRHGPGTVGQQLRAPARPGCGCDAHPHGRRENRARRRARNRAGDLLGGGHLRDAGCRYRAGDGGAGAGGRHGVQRDRR